MRWGPGSGQSHLQAWKQRGHESAQKAREWNRLTEKSTDEIMKPDISRHTHTLPACRLSSSHEARLYFLQISLKIPLYPYKRLFFDLSSFEDSGWTPDSHRTSSQPYVTQFQNNRNRSTIMVEVKSEPEGGWRM